jgi:CubicO group peptidase (beta-lactamase class C family)
MFTSRKLTLFRVLLTFVIGALPLWGGISQAAQSTDVAAELDVLFTKFTDQDIFNGAVLVARDGEILLSKGYGMANLDWDIPNTPDTKFRIGSITKQFTAMATLLLQEQGSLNVQDKVCNYIEECPEAWKDITIHHLLTHTSGLRDLFTYRDLDVTKRSRPETTIKLFLSDPLNFEPGTRWQYSSSGYVLLASIIKIVSGESYHSYLRKNLLEPLGMNDTGFFDNQDIVKRRATGYTNGTEAAAYIDETGLFGGGGLYSTVEDLYLWEQALWTGQVVSQESLDAMFAMGVSEQTNPPFTYLYGLEQYELDGHRAIGHSGLINGFAAMMEYFPDDKVTVIVLSNYDQVISPYIADAAAQLLFRES